MISCLTKPPRSAPSAQPPLLQKEGIFARTVLRVHGTQQGRDCSLPLSCSVLQAQASGAVTDLIDFRICEVCKSKKQVRGRFFVFDRDVAIPF